MSLALQRLSLWETSRVPPLSLNPHIRPLSGRQNLHSSSDELEDLLVALIIHDQRCRETTQQAFCKYTNCGISTQIHTCKEPSSLYGGFICLEHAQ